MGKPVNKEVLMTRLVESWTDAMELDDLIEYFQDDQFIRLEKLTETELIKLYNENFESEG